MAYSKMPKHKMPAHRAMKGKGDKTHAFQKKESGKTGRSGSTARERRLEKEKM